MVKSFYIHIPFCNNICSYCDFAKVYYNKNLVDKYLTALEKEIEKVYQNEVLDTIYIGGGTPSSLSLNETKRLFKILKKLKKSKRLEYTIEANFDSITSEKLDLYKENGINRISFGLESTSPKHLKFLNRSIDLTKVRNIINYTKSIGINNINVDLIYALENESIKDLSKDLDFILSLDITHISTYSLIIEEHTKLYLDNVKNISEDKDFEMYEFIKDKLKKNGFNHYEISNFSKDGYESRHNLSYWNNLEYYGTGVGASSYIKDKRYTNTKSLTKYLEKSFIKEEEILTLDDKCIYEIILGLRKIKGIDKNEFSKKYNSTIYEKFDIMDLLDKKLLCEDERYLFIPEDKLYLENEILLSFIGGSSSGKE